MRLLATAVAACLALLASVDATPASPFKRLNHPNRRAVSHHAHDASTFPTRNHKTHQQVYGTDKKVQRMSKKRRVQPHEHLQTDRAQKELHKMKTMAKAVQAPLSNYTAAAQADAITSLPGLVDSINFNQFSGFLNAGGSKHLHYWFVESMNDPANDPLIWWTNGGPGCSGLIAFFEEHGPFRIQPDNSTVLLNPYAWNRLANVIFIEAPVGVGFSYSTNSTDYTLSSDEYTAEQNFAALQSFWQKFPQYKQGTRPFWLTGESWGGHYVPQLALKFAQNGAPADVVYLGNPYVDAFSNEYEGAIATYYGHSLISYDAWQNVTDSCITPFLSNPYNPSNGSGFQPWNDDACNNADNYAEELVIPQYYGTSDYGLDPYGLDFPYCDLQESLREQLYYQQEKSSLLSATQYNRDITALTQTAGVNKTYFGACQSNWLTVYLNRTDVLEAIHVNYANNAPNSYTANSTTGELLSISPDRSWQECNNLVGYYWPSDASYTPQEPVYQQLIDLAPNMQFIIFSGDDDSVCATTGTQYWLNNFKLLGGSADLTPITPWTAWFDDAQPDQYGGYYQKYDKITLTTIHGAGHEVEFYQPERGYANFEKAINGFWNVQK